VLTSHSSPPAYPIRWVQRRPRPSRLLAAGWGRRRRLEELLDRQPSRGGKRQDTVEVVAIGHARSLTPSPPSRNREAEKLPQRLLDATRGTKPGRGSNRRRHPWSSRTVHQWSSARLRRHADRGGRQCGLQGVAPRILPPLGDHRLRKRPKSLHHPVLLLWRQLREAGLVAVDEDRVLRQVASLASVWLRHLFDERLRPLGGH
jgi:hypothetical protein